MSECEELRGLIVFDWERFYDGLGKEMVELGFAKDLPTASSPPPRQPRELAS